MKRFSKYIVAFFLFFAITADGQVNAPDIQCVSNDSVFWSIPFNNCGPFISYDLYFATNINGPYSLLASVNDNTQYFFFHDNPANTTFYYYVEGNYNCPGETVLQSDTINNLPLLAFPIDRVTVVGNTTVIEWIPAQNAYAYIIYKDTDIGTVPIDTVFGVNSYIDLNADPNNQVESYYVVSLNECGSTSIFNDPHNSILLDTFLDPCTQTISLDWNLYQNWPGGIASHEIWVGVNGAAPQIVETIGGSTNTFDFTDTNDGDTYCFIINAISADPTVNSQSNQVCVQADIVQPNDDLLLRNVSIGGGGQVTITWSSQADAEFILTNVAQSNQNGNFSLISSEPAIPPVPAIETYSYDTDVAGQNKIFYQVSTVDECGVTTNSNYGSTIFVSGIALLDNTNQVSWTAFDIEGADLIKYELYRVVNGDVEEIILLDDTFPQHIDDVDASNANETVVCYFVVASATITLSDGTTDLIQSRSNTTCIQQKGKVWVPNAFAPDGANKEFKPVVVFGQNVDYLMEIYDRWGRLVFTSIEIETGWLGKDGDGLAAQGVYVYRIRLEQLEGEVIEKQGSLVLLR